jgi:hypothetical protein
MKDLKARGSILLSLACGGCVTNNKSILCLIHLRPQTLLLCRSTEDLTASFKKVKIGPSNSIAESTRRLKPAGGKAGQRK